ncbi:RNA exonuclease 3 [Cytospora mali]|uniref:RNA exonuclease 3 n=1 Tax=Cytospora mali TaxID=578113 RepID=A0A194VM58_CYTMA|nr:RNA exonuclease 3 [Valsa mali]
MDQLSPSVPQVSPAVLGGAGLPSDASPGTALLPLETSASGALLLGPYPTKEAYMKRFQALKQNTETLEKAGYVMRVLTEKDLGQKRKCLRCHKFLVKKPFKVNRERKPRPGSVSSGMPEIDRVLGGVAISSPPAAISSKTFPSDRNSAKEPKQDCKYHDGTFNGRIWSCCRTGVYNTPCKTSAEHLAAVYQPGELEQLYRFYSTPTAPHSQPRRLAVAIDCEMGTSITNSPVLIRVTLIDYFTSKVLIDKLVFPDEPVLHYNTRFSGVTYAQMAKARSRGECLYGTAAARNAIWKFVGPDTIVVAHSGNNDMSVLRWIHGSIVDTFLVESLPVVKLQKEAREEEIREKQAREEAGMVTGPSEKKQQSSNPGQPTGEPKKKRPKGSGQFSLKTLARERLGRDIQMGKGGHDSIEDAIAARDIAAWNVLNFGRVVYTV